MIVFFIYIVWAAIDIVHVSVVHYISEKFCVGMTKVLSKLSRFSAIEVVLPKYQSEDLGLQVMAVRSSIKVLQKEVKKQTFVVMDL